MIPALRIALLSAAAAAAGGLVYGCADIVAVPLAPSLADAGPTPGAIGDPCVPSDEKEGLFSGFRVNELDLVTNDFTACQSGVCLVNHFQGRESCPLGQAPPTACAGPSDTSCPSGSTCVEAGDVAQYCDPLAKNPGSTCASGACNAQRSDCECTEDAHCPDGTRCDTAAKACKRYVCRAPGCQSAGAGDAENQGKGCCVPGSDAPIAAGVCGQCEKGSHRDAEAVYCSCRCGAADGAPPEDAGSFCACPQGFECSEVRPYVFPGEPSGKYCIKQGSEFTDESTCGEVRGYLDPQVCDGTAPSP